MAELIGLSILILVFGSIITGMLIAEKRRNTLPEDDGIVWNTAIQERHERERKAN